MNEIAIIIHWLKAFTMGAIMFFALSSLGFNTSVSFLAAFIPFLLGGLNVMSSLAYSSTAIAFIICVLSLMFPDFLNAITTLLGEELFELDLNLGSNKDDEITK